MVTVFELGYHTDGSPYIVMELLKGLDLQKAARQTPPMTVEQKVAIIVQVLGGLAHAHKAGIVHRDIKPANIFIGDDGAVKIMDFGVARITTASMTGHRQHRGDRRLHVPGAGEGRARSTAAATSSAWAACSSSWWRVAAPSTPTT